MNRPLKHHFMAFVIFALIGLIFSSVSTYDFVAHLDRQVHSITCSLVPGLTSADDTGASGCHTVMMSPYSSIFRASLWGGIPISLFAMAVFAFLLWRGGDIWLRQEENDADETRFMVAAAGLPLLMTVIYFLIATFIVGTVCQLCVGIYVASIGAFGAAVLGHLKNSRRMDPEKAPKVPFGVYGIYFLEGVVFVVVPLLLYLGLGPDVGNASSDCGELRHLEDKYNVRIKLHSAKGGVSAIEVFDPLCPACKGFDARLASSGLLDQLDLEAVMFPLDSDCNWMVSDSLHPGACAVSEAILCADESAAEVISWAFAEQEKLRSMAKEDVATVYDEIKRRFPQIADCVGKPAVKSKLNKSLRWAVSNSIPVLTPQLYVAGKKLCDEDTDLGLEYTLRRMLANQPGMKVY